MIAARRLVREIEREHQRVVAERAKRSFRYFIAQAWPSIEPTPFEPSWHIDAIAEHLTALLRGDIRNLVINIPPRHGKSLLAMVLWPAWVWLNRPGFRFLTASYSATLAERDAGAARALMGSPWFQSVNIDPRTDDPVFSINTKGRPETARLKDLVDWYENDRGGRRVTAGVDGKATGEGGDAVCIDDPHNPKQALSDAQRVHATTWIDRTMSTRLNDQRTGRKLIIMQRLHERDATGHVLAKELGYVLLKVSAEFVPERRCFTAIGWADPRTAPGELIWPRVGRPEIETLKKELGPIAAAGQLQQEPAPEGGTIFRRIWFKLWTTLPPRFDRRLLSWDLAFGGTDDSSFVVGQVWGVAGANAYLLDQFREQVDFKDSLEAFKGQVARWLAFIERLIEKKANADALISMVRDTIPGIIPVNPRGDKVSRAKAVQPLVAAGNVWLPADAPWLETYLGELTMFPNSLHKDQVDATTQLLTHVFIPEDGDGGDAARTSEILAQW